MVAANLTDGAGGVGGQYTVADWERAVRQGIDPAGHALMVMMPSRTYHNMSDADIQALSVYLDQLPPANNELPPTELHLLGKVIAANAPLFVPDVVDATATPPATTPAADDPMALGEYYSKAACQECHGDDLRGAPHPGGDAYPYATDLAIVKGYSMDDFERAMREGVKPNGQTMDGEVMPWVAFQHFTDAELSAIFAFLQTLPDPEPAQAAVN